MGRTAIRITAVIATAAVGYVRRALGDEAAASLLERVSAEAGDVLRGQGGDWLDLEDVSALVERAGELCADQAIGRRIGEQYFFDHREQGITNFLLAEGDPVAAMRLAVPYATRMSTAREFTIVDSADTTLTVRSSTVAAGRRAWWCEVAIGYWSNIPSLFGAVGSVVEVACQTRGDDHCEFLMRWDQPVSLVEADAMESRNLAGNTIERFELLQQMAAELLLADDLATVLDRVVRRVRSGVMVPEVVVTVRASENDEPQTVALGMVDAEASTAAAALWEGRSPREGRRALVAPVASPHRLYGYIAAILAPGEPVLDMDQRLLDAYAGNATAAIERAVSMEDAKRSHQTTAALLALARSLSTADSVDEVCQQITDAVPLVVGGDIGGVWLWNEAEGSLTLRAASTGWQLLGQHELQPRDVSTLAGLLDDPQPIRVTDESDDPAVVTLLQTWGVREAFAAPIMLRGSFLGLVAASSTTPTTDRATQERMLGRLGALADHASTALDSSILLEQVRHQAMHDALTRLPNRALAEARTREALTHASIDGTSGALLFVDLDRFKNVNDTLGHAAGDELICDVANRLRHCARASDTVARLGGDEFLVLLPRITGAPEPVAIAVAEKMIEAVREPFEVRGQSLYISASIGIVCYPQHGTDYTTLMQDADVAMYQAKAYGRSTYAMHAEEFSSERRSRLQLESELHGAVERDELVVEYQPQVDLATTRVVGVEALVRWEHRRLGRLAPDAFLAIAEESGVIVMIDRWVRRVALAQAKVWADAGTPIRVAVNLSTRDMRDPLVADEIAAVVDETGIDPGLVELEITDRVVITSADLTDVLGRLRAIGVRLAIDDFGTGSSVLARLQHAPIDVLKIDRGFISELGAAGADHRLVHALISMAHALRLEVVAEGVETAEQAEILRSYGCELGQGYLYGRPTDPATITAMLGASVR